MLTERQRLLIAFLLKPFDDGYKRESILKYDGKPSRFRLLAVQPVVYATLTRHDRDGDLHEDRGTD